MLLLLLLLWLLRLLVVNGCGGRSCGAGRRFGQILTSCFIDDLLHFVAAAKEQLDFGVFDQRFVLSGHRLPGIFVGGERNERDLIRSTDYVHSTVWNEKARKESPNV